MAGTGSYLERIRRVYFSDPDKRMSISRGEVLMRQGEAAEKLYYVLSGTFVGGTMMETAQGEYKSLELFRVERGGFIGVHGFFSDSGLTSFDVAADSDGELAWIERGVEAVDREQYGSLKEQFFPIIMNEMDKRQIKLSRAAKEREAYLRRLHIAEDMANLGRFAAGLAHELNNAIGVLMSASDHLCILLAEFFQRYDPELAPWFLRGIESPHSMSSAEVRPKAREIAGKYALDYETAKDYVRMTKGEDSGRPPKNFETVRAAWNSGKNCRDIRFTAGHAADIIQSIKQLSGGGQGGVKGTASLEESIHDALSLLRNKVGNVGIALDIERDLPEIPANKSELIQIWMNVIKNALEAMRDAETPNPRISIRARRGVSSLSVSISNNGPEILPAIRKKLFQPSITTKNRSGNSMGLGLGLYIVKRLVDSYHGEIVLEDRAPETCFTVHLPLSGGGKDA